MFENIGSFFKKIMKNDTKELVSDTTLSNASKEAAKERLQLVLMQDRANVSADFLELMKQEIVDVIKKYIVVEEETIDVRIINQENADGTQGAPSLCANIPILNIRNDNKGEKFRNEQSPVVTKEDDAVEENVEKNVEENSVDDSKDDVEIENVVEEKVEEVEIQEENIEKESEASEENVEQEVQEVKEEAEVEKNIEEIVEELEIEDFEQIENVSADEDEEDDDDVTFDDLLKAAEEEEKNQKAALASKTSTNNKTKKTNSSSKSKNNSKRKKTNKK